MDQLVAALITTILVLLVLLGGALWEWNKCWNEKETLREDLTDALGWERNLVTNVVAEPDPPYARLYVVPGDDR